ncbi:MAG: fibronectin type III domain-containing protein [Vicinamibacterales bacterium]
MPRIRRVVLSLLLVLCTHAAYGQADPRSLPLLPPSGFSSLHTYTFVFDWSDGAGGSLSYGGGAIGVSEDGNYLYISCQQDDTGIAKLEIPRAGGLARVVAPCLGPKRADIAKIHPDPTAFRPMVGGVLEQGGRLCVTGYISYDATGQTTASHWCGPSLTSLAGPFAGSVAPGMVKSQMAPIPQEWRALLGGPAFSTAGYTSIISRASYGAAFTVFNPADVTRNGFPMTMLLGCPHSVPSCLTYGTPTSNAYNGSELSGGAFIVPGSRTLAVIERESSGPTCYGYATRDPNLHGLPYLDAVYCYSLSDPLNQKGPKGYPYRLVAKLYDMAELVAVKQGLKQPWDIRQYATVDMPGSGPGEFIQSGAFNPVRGEYYLIRYLGNGLNTVSVYTSNASVPVSAPSAPGNLRAVASGSSLTLTWDFPQVGSVSGFVVDAGTAAGQSNIANGVSVGAGLTLTAQGVPAGRYFLRVRAIGPGGSSPPSNEAVTDVTGGSGGGGGGGGGIPTGPPGAPDGFRATADQSRRVTLTWSPPERGAPPTGYLVEVGTGPGRSDLAAGIPLPVATSFSAPGVAPGVYYLRLRAVNAQGVGPVTPEVRLVVP